MAIAVAPYNPWRENLAAQILGSVAQNYLQNQRASEVSKKWGALMGLFPMEGQDQDAATINRMVEEQRQISERDAIAHLLSKQASAGLTGIPQTGASEDIRYGLSGATRQAMPQLDKWQTPEGVAAEQVLLDRITNSYLPPSESEGANWNMNSYNAGMANRIPMQFTPEGVFSKAAETPNYKFKDMINALADPRFSPYAKELMAEIKNLEDLYTSRRNNNYLDMEAAKKNLIGAYQANMIMRHAQDLPTAMTALSAFYSNPAEHATSMAASNQKNFFDSMGNRLLAGERAYGSELDAAAKRFAAQKALEGQLGYNATQTERNKIERERLKLLGSGQEDPNLRAAKSKASSFANGVIRTAYPNAGPENITTQETMRSALENAYLAEGGYLTTPFGSLPDYTGDEQSAAYVIAAFPAMKNKLLKASTVNGKVDRLKLMENLKGVSFGNSRMPVKLDYLTNVADILMAGR